MNIWRLQVIDKKLVENKNRLEVYNKETQLVVYGTGKCAEAFLSLYGLSVEDVILVSSFDNQYLHQVKAQLLEELNYKEKYQFVIASEYIYEIYQAIESAKLNVGQIDIYLFDKKQLVAASDYLRMLKSDRTFMI
jgi:hypothetical protein